MNRRNGAQRGGTLGGDSADLTMFPKSVFWLAFHCLCCVVTFALGFRFTRLIFFIFLSTSTPYTQRFVSLPSPPVNPPPANASRRVVAGRHGIPIRPWPHPDPNETMKAHEIIRRVQSEQRARFGVKNARDIIVITPTYVRTFQKMHLTGLMHSLMLSSCGIQWIIVEAGGVSNETAAIYAGSGLSVVHVGFQQRMGSKWEERHVMEMRMRIRGLREVKARKLEGIIVFGDDSNMHSMEFFDEIQELKWFGAVSVGILMHSDDDSYESAGFDLPVQGPACNSSKKLIGWRTFDSAKFNGSSAVYIDDLASVVPSSFEWAGFVMNSRLLWARDAETPPWFLDIDSPLEEITSPLSLVKDKSAIEPLGNCGKQVLIWWLRVEARFDSKFPPGWIIDPPLEITVPSKETRWLMRNEDTSDSEVKTGDSKSRYRSKSKQTRKKEDAFSLS